MVKHEDGALLRRQSPEGSLDPVTVDYRVFVRRVRQVNVELADLDGAAATRPDGTVARSNEDPVHPAFECVGIPKRRETPPDLDQGPLHGVTGRVAVTQDQGRRADEASGHRCGQPLERLVLAALCADDHCPHRAPGGFRGRTRSVKEFADPLVAEEDAVEAVVDEVVDREPILVGLARWNEDDGFVPDEAAHESRRQVPSAG